MPQLATLTNDDSAKALIALVQSQGDIARLTVGPPDIPADRLAALRDAYKSALQDLDLLAKAKKLEIPIDPLYGDDALKRVKEALKQPPETIKLLKEYLGKPAKDDKSGKESKS